MEVSGQLHASAALPPGKDFSKIQFNTNLPSNRRTPKWSLPSRFLS